MPPVETAQHTMNLLGLFWQADPIVKGVMLVLVLASVAVWAVILEKLFQLARLRREAARFERAVRTEELNGVDTGLAADILSAGHLEWQERNLAHESRGEMRERFERAMRAVMGARLRAAEPGLPLLATVGSVAPFVGLFGTVWGIMNSFTAIASANDTSLAVVAPGIAEALFATAIGLVAAIPAVVAYNKLSTDLGRIGQRFSAAITECSARLIRREAV